MSDSENKYRILIFKKAYREIEFNKNYTLKELCDQINKISNSRFYSSINSDRITVCKKIFIDFSLFNFGHLGAMTIKAKSIEIESETDKLKFIIEMSILTKFATYLSIVLLIGIAIVLLIGHEIRYGCVLLLFTAIGIIWSNIVHNWGITNFTENWDKLIGSKV